MTKADAKNRLRGSQKVFWVVSKKRELLKTNGKLNIELRKLSSIREKGEVVGQIPYGYRRKGEWSYLR